MAKRRELYGCERCGRMYGGTQIGRCPATNGYSCYYCCKRCKYHTEHPLCGAIGCSYGKTKEVQV